MARGAKPGERRGGRIKGVPNKAALARAAELAEEKRRQGKPIAVEVMEDAMLRNLSLAAQFQKGGPSPDPDKFDKYLERAHEKAKDLAPYQTPKLQSTTLIGDRDKPISHTLTVKFV